MSLSRLTTKQKRNAARKEADVEIEELLTSARPVVTPLLDDTANRILVNALREAPLSSTASSPRLAGARIVLSATFCVCAAAGLLLLRSVASERSNRQHNVEQQIEVRTCPPTRAPFSERRRPQLIAYQWHTGASSFALNHMTTSRSQTDAVSAPQEEYQAPPSPVCGMTTFAIFAPLPAVAAPSQSRDNVDESEGESLLICIVSDDQSDGTSAAQHSEGAAEKISNPAETPVPDMFLVSRFREEQLFMEDSTPSSSSKLILLGSAASAYFGDNHAGHTESFTLHTVCTGLELSLPDYSAI